MRKLQTAFLGDIRQKTTALSPLIKPGGRLSARKAIQVYQQGYIARLNGALGETYETLWYVLGDKRFFKLCADYRQSHKSRTYNLNHYGLNLPAFVKKHYPEQPYLFHIAEFEKLIAQIFNAAEPETKPVDFSRVKPNRDVLVFHDYVTLFQSPYRLYELWKNRSKIPQGYSPKNFETREYQLLYKYEHRHYFAVFTKAQFGICKNLLKGKTIEQALKTQGNTGKISEDEVSSLFSLIAMPGIVRALNR